MRYLERERAALERLLPGLDGSLAGVPLAELEQQGSPAIGLFREHGGPALLIPEEHEGLGADLLTAVRVQRAIGSRSPSLAVATTMHHFSVASLLATAQNGTGLEWMLVSAIATNRLLLSSAFAEGRTGAHILSPSLEARVEGGKIFISGAKKPLSLARSMDLITASLMLPDEDGTPRLAVALVPAGAPGVSVRPFWSSPILAGAESDELVLHDVQLDEEMIVRTDVTADGRLDHLNTVGFVWFELLMTASYLGTVSGLVERVLRADKVDPARRADIASTVEAAALTVEAVARATAAEPMDDDLLAAALHARYAAQNAIDRVAGQCVEALGGMAFIGSGDVAYLNSACRALAFHPPSRARMAGALLDHLSGAPLRIS